jgi:hypothetical protein
MSARRLKRLTLNRLDTVYKASKKVAGKWDPHPKFINLKVYAQVIDKSKWDEKKVTDPVALDFLKRYNNILDLLFKAAADTAKEMGTELVSLEYVRESINVIKESYEKGTKEENGAQL